VQARRASAGDNLGSDHVYCRIVCRKREAITRVLVEKTMPGSFDRERRARGHDVFAVEEALRGECDDLVIARAQAEGRILLAQVEDFALPPSPFGRLRCDSLFALRREAARRRARICRKKAARYLPQKSPCFA
jgi:hypothetical protein